MLYSKPCEYAIRALAQIAQAPKNEEVRAQEIARKEKLPRPVLAKVLQELVRKGLLKSRRGPGGGFRLARRADRSAPKCRPTWKRPLSPRWPAPSIASGAYNAVAE